MNWNLRYAREMDEEALNRFIPTTSYSISFSYPINLDKNSSQFHELDRPVGPLRTILTDVSSIENLRTPVRARLLEDLSSEPSEWDFRANEALDRHFEKNPIDLPNKVDLHHPDNHRHILNRVKSWIAYHT